MVCESVPELIHSLKLVDYLPVQMHKPYNIVALSCNLYPDMVASFALYTIRIIKRTGPDRITTNKHNYLFETTLHVNTCNISQSQDSYHNNCICTLSLYLCIQMYTISIIIKPTDHNTITTDKYNNYLSRNDAPREYII